jgi:hypothetical protein
VDGLAYGLANPSIDQLGNQLIDRRTDQLASSYWLPTNLPVASLWLDQLVTDRLVND